MAKKKNKLVKKVPQNLEIPLAKDYYLIPMETLKQADSKHLFAGGTGILEEIKKMLPAEKIEAVLGTEKGTCRLMVSISEEECQRIISEAVKNYDAKLTS